MKCLLKRLLFAILYLLPTIFCLLAFFATVFWITYFGLNIFNMSLTWITAFGALFCSSMPNYFEFLYDKIYRM